MIRQLSDVLFKFFKKVHIYAPTWGVELRNSQGLICNLQKIRHWFLNTWKYKVRAVFCKYTINMHPRLPNPNGQVYTTVFLKSLSLSKFKPSTAPYRNPKIASLTSLKSSHQSNFSNFPSSSLPVSTSNRVTSIFLFILTGMTSRKVSYEELNCHPIHQKQLPVQERDLSCPSDSYNPYGKCLLWRIGCTARQFCTWARCHDSLWNMIRVWRYVVQHDNW